MTIVIFNGPPTSGKDAGCEFLKTNKGFTHIEFKKQLFEDVLEYFNVDREWFFSEYFMPNKDFKEEKLGGKSRREALIHVSENIKKKEHGPGYYGECAANSMEDLNGNYCISDGGFVSELDQIINKFGKDEIVFIRLYRDDCDFSNDSRRYIRFNNLVEEKVCGSASDVSKYEEQFFPESVNVNGYIVHNNGSIVDLYQTIEDIVKAHNDRKNTI